MVRVELKCIYCESINLIKAGKNPCRNTKDRIQRYRCKDCGKYFQKDYKYLACNPEIKDKIRINVG